MEGEEIESHKVNKLEEFVIDNDNVLLVLTEREYIVKGNSSDRLNECVKQVTDLTGVKLTDLLYNSFSDTVEEKFITYNSILNCGRIKQCTKTDINEVRRIITEYAQSDCICVIFKEQPLVDDLRGKGTFAKRTNRIARKPVGFIIGDQDLTFETDDKNIGLLFDVETNTIRSKNFDITLKTVEDKRCIGCDEEISSCRSYTGADNYKGYNTENFNESSIDFGDDALLKISFITIVNSVRLLEFTSEKEYGNYEIAIFRVDRNSLPEYAYHTYYDVEDDLEIGY